MATTFLIRLLEFKGVCLNKRPNYNSGNDVQGKCPVTVYQHSPKTVSGLTFLEKFDYRCYLGDVEIQL
jgi:hypothetical protein